MITIKETAWFVEIDLANDPQLELLGVDIKGGAGLILSPQSILETLFLTEAYQKLCQLANYELKVFDRTPPEPDDEDADGLDLGDEKPKQAGHHDPVKTRIVNVTQAFINEDGHPILRLPKAKLKQVVNTLKQLKMPHEVILREYPKPKLQAVFKNYPNPARYRNPEAPETIRLENLQIEALRDGLLQNQPGALVYAMGGGKSVLIAAILAAFPQLRPAVVTSAASSDSQQLAYNLRLLLGEKVKLVGCQSGGLTTAEKKELFSKSKDADIIVGSHRLYERVAPAREGKAKKPVKGAAAILQEKIAGAKIVIIDEAHECTTENRLHSLSCTTPEIVFALTATWLKNWSKADAILADMLNVRSMELCDITHSQVEETGRVTPTEIYGYTLDRRDFPIPETAQGGYRGFGYMQQEVEFHPGRNLFLAHLCNHLLEKNSQEGRGCILAFTNTIQHAKRVVRELCYLRGIRYSESEMEFDSIYLFNSQISETEKTRRMTAMREGRTRIVFSTETLSRGIDMNTIYDVVDLTGSSKIVQLIQKSGRSVRPDGADKVARVHVVVEQDLLQFTGRDRIMLRKISENKLRALRTYFDKEAQVLKSHELPWSPRKEVPAPSKKLDVRSYFKPNHDQAQSAALPTVVSGS